MLSEINFKSVGKAALYFLAFCGVVYLFFEYLLSPLLPFLIGYLIAEGLYRPCEFLAKKTRINRKIVCAVLIFAVFALILTLIGIAGAQIVGELSSLAENLGNFFKNAAADENFLREELRKAAQKLNITFADLSQNSVCDRILSEIIGFLKSIAEKLTGDLLPVLVNFLSFVPESILHVFTCALSCFYFISEKGKISAFIKDLLPSDFKSKFVNAFCRAKKSVLVMIKAYFFIFVMTFIQLLIGFLILRVKYSFIAALFTAFIDILPVLGTGTVLIPRSIFLFFRGQTALGIGTLVLWLIITVIREISEPKILGRYLDLHPLTTLFSMYFGLKLFGFAGVILFPIFVTAVFYGLGNKGFDSLSIEKKHKIRFKIPKTRKK